MTDDSGTHIASDEELLSRYVLGRLDQAERERIERHTAGCGTCMEALRHEMRIVAGVRRLGREDLKAELKRRMAAEPARWPRILSAAALVGIVAGLGVYYAWFNGGGRLPSRAGEAPPLAGRTEPLNKDETKAPAERRADNVMAKRNGGNERKTDSGREGAATSEASGGAPTGEPGGEFWADGIVEPVGAAAARGALEAGKNAVPLFKSKAIKEEEDRMKEALPRAQGHYLLRQQPASTLPLERERSGRNQQKVPTRVDQQGRTTTMTMYLDSLLDEKDLQRASVEAVRDDSLVVTLGGKKILYRFPPGQGAQQQRQK